VDDHITFYAGYALDGRRFQAEYLPATSLLLQHFVFVLLRRFAALLLRRLGRWRWGRRLTEVCQFRRMNVIHHRPLGIRPTALK
jgi:hypothetical protein